MIALTRRGRADRLALQEATLAALSTVVLGLAVNEPGRILAQFDELDESRKIVGP